MTDYQRLGIIIGAVISFYILPKLTKILIYKIKTQYRYKRYLNSPLAVIDKMSGEEFEHYLMVHFQKIGYRVKLTPKSNDFGADLILKKKGMCIVVQAKRYRNKVGVKAVQEIIGAKGYYKADKMMVVSNSFFTSSASKLAKANGVELWDRNTINKLFEIKDF